VPVSESEAFDVVVVGAGNAALCAALAAREQGARVAVLERATKREHGGNSRFTMASMRFAYDGVVDLMEVAPQLTAEDRARADFGAYTEAQYLADLDSTSGGRCDPDLARALVSDSRATLRWMAGQGVRFVPLWGNQSFVGDDGRHRFWGGLTLQAARGGPGLVLALRRAACKAKIRVIHETRALGLVRQRDGIAGVEVEQRGERRRIGAGAVVLACGGFEANAEWRAEHLGAPWRFAKVRGTRHNTGDGIAMALAAGARAGGQWSGCHAVQWDRSAPDTGDLRVRHAFQKHSYPLGILVNARGERFVDEGYDFRNYTYARYGRAVLEQPGRFAWQIFDARTTPLLRDEYEAPHATRADAATLEELAPQLEGVDAERFLATVAQYNAAVDEGRPFDPARKDGRRTRGLAVEKTNWANRIDRAPFRAYAVTCGITFTYGGLAIDPRSRVLDEAGKPIPGLYAAGELVGGLFWDNYPGGAGLMAGAVFGRRAGEGAAARP
jgi:tricarballylate dehydrogenase